MPPLTVDTVGYGAGTATCLTRPTSCAAFWARRTASEAGDETVLEIETTIDDMSPQLYEPLIERLFGAGALDVYLQPVIMKRGRPGIVVTALCPPDRVGDLSQALSRSRPRSACAGPSGAGRVWSARSSTLTTAYGAIPFKVSRLSGRVVDSHARVRRRGAHRPREVPAVCARCSTRPAPTAAALAP
jgi:uncharacterized protein (DUF111 family)